MTLRTNLTDADVMATLHAAQHNEVNTDMVSVLQYIPATVSTHFKTDGFNPFNAAVSNAPGGGVNLEYLWPLQVLYPCTITGVGIYNGATAAGNLKGTWRSATGTLVTSTASTAQSGTYTVQTVAFSAAQTIGPGLYYVGMILSSATATCIMESGIGGASFTATSLTPLSSITPPSTSTGFANFPALLTY